MQRRLRRSTNSRSCVKLPLSLINGLDITKVQSCARTLQRFFAMPVRRSNSRQSKSAREDLASSLKQTSQLPFTVSRAKTHFTRLPPHGYHWCWRDQFSTSEKEKEEVKILSRILVLAKRSRCFLCLKASLRELTSWTG